MRNRRRRSTPSHRNVGKRQDLPVSFGLTGSTGSKDTTVIPTASDPLSLKTPTLLPIPTSSPTPSDTTITIVSNSPSSRTDTSTTFIFVSHTPSSAASSLSSSIVSTAPPVAIPASSSTFPSTFPSASDSSSGSDVTSYITTISGAVPTTITSIIGPSASLSPAPKSTPSFFQNKAESGAVLGVAALVAFAGIGFLGLRFYKTMKARRADRETEDAARDAAKVRVRLDDDDMGYGGASNAHGMAQYHNRPPVITGGFDFNDGRRAGGVEERRSAESINPYLDNEAYSVPLHHQPIQHGDSPYLQAPHDPHDPEHGYATQSLRSLRNSTESQDHLLSRSELPESLSKQSSTAAVSSAQLPSQPSAFPTLPLPEAFGEGELDRPIPPPEAQPLGDDEDYTGYIGRVLKIANE